MHAPLLSLRPPSFSSRFGGAWRGWLVGSLVVAAWPAQAGLWADLPVGTGYAARELCTRVLAAGDDLARVRSRYTEPKVSPLPWLWRVNVKPGDAVEVDTWLPFTSFKRVAVYRPGAGCTLLTPGTDRASWEASAPRPGPALAPLTAAQRAMPWPLGEGAPEPLHAGSVQAQALQQVSDVLFDEPATDPKARQNTLAVLVVKDGRLVHERYAPGYGPGMPLLGWSMTKTVTALWAGVALGEGLLGLDDALPIPGWQGRARPSVTWRHALQMASGLDWFEGHAGHSDVSEMVFSQTDEGAYVAAKAQAFAPGTHFNYATGDSALLARSLKQVLGDDAQRAHDHQVAALFTPLGMRGAFVEADVAGTPSGGSRAVLRPRDWLKLAQLILQDGQWQGVQRIPASYIRFMRTPSPANPAYGGQLWLHQPAEMPPGMPTDVAYFSGLMGQYVVMVPSQKLIVLRMGVSFDKDETRRRVFQATQRLSRAFSEPERGLASAAAAQGGSIRR